MVLKSLNDKNDYLMELRIKQMLVWGFILTMLISCDKDGSSLRPNIFDNDDTKSYLNITQSSNADTVFLSWELLNADLSFDYYQVSETTTNQTVTADRSSEGCILTHVPYNQQVKISVSLIKEQEVVKTIERNVTITGLDTVFAGTLIPDRGSVTGGDGTYSIALPDGRSIFLMGDSYIGPVTNGARSMSDYMFRNTYIMYNNGNVSAIYGANGDKTSAAVPPGVTDEGQKWYWPGHGFVNDNKLYIFQTLMYQGASGMWGFMYEKTDILEYSLPDMELLQTTSVPFEGSTDIHFGMAALKENDYIYIYAQKDVDNGLDPISDALVARTTPDNLYTSWEYFDGSGWSGTPSDAVKMEGLSGVAVSSQFNVFKINGKYVLLTQEKQFNSGEIYTFIADNPQGPWYNKQLIYTVPQMDDSNLFTYNAMVHPQFEKDGMILISYNINTSDFQQQHDDVSTYRPRFFWIDTNKILGN